MSSNSKMTILIYHFVDAIFNDKNFLFEFDDINLTMYVHFMNSSTQIIVVRNDNFKIVKIFRNFRLKYLTKMNYSNVFFVDNDVVELIIKTSRSSYKFSWFKKIIVIFVIIWIVTIVFLSSSFDATLSIVLVIHTSSLQLFFTNINISILFDISIISHLNFITKFFANFSNVILSNDVTIYFSIDVKIFFKLIDEFSSFWKNNEFVILSKKNWMRISFKFDWKKRVFDKTKIYSLRTRDKTLINKLFDELQNLSKLF